MQDNDCLTYLNIMLDSLKKKDRILTGLLAETKKQSELLAAETLDYDAFDETISEKEKLLTKLSEADDGFMDMYGRVKDALAANGFGYRNQVEEAKVLVKRQMEQSFELQALEEKNKNRLAIHLSKGKQKIKDFKISSKTAAAYYKNMSNKHQEGDSYFLDRKK